MFHGQPRRYAVRSKQKSVPLEDGWTLVTRSAHSGPPRTQCLTAARHSPTSEKDDDSLLEALGELYQIYLARWKETQCAKTLFKDCRDNGDARFEPLNAVCVGLGNFGFLMSSRAGKPRPVGLKASRLRKIRHEELVLENHRSIWQLAAFMGMVEMLCPTPIPLYAQDPGFTPLEEAFLESIGITVLHTPEASEYIHQATFVYAPYLEIEILLAEVLNGNDPLVYVGTDVDVMWDRMDRSVKHLLLGRCRDDESRLRKLQLCADVACSFCINRKKSSFPAFDPFPEAFYGMSIWWRQNAFQEGHRQRSESRDGQDEEVKEEP